MPFRTYPDSQPPEDYANTNPQTPPHPADTSPPLTAQHISASLQLLADVCFEREQDLSNFNDSPDQDFDNEQFNSNAPLFDQFYDEGGREGIKGLINFTPEEFETLWATAETHVLPRYNTGRGQRSKVTAKDALFCTMTVLKHGGQWQILARVFNMKPPTFERLVTRFLRLVSDYLYVEFVTKVGNMYSMERLMNEQGRFDVFK